MRHNGMENVLMLIIGALMVTAIAIGISYVNKAAFKTFNNLMNAKHIAIERVIE